MQKVVINFKTDTATKHELQKYAEELGITTSNLLNAQIRQMLRTRTTVLTDKLVPTAELIKNMEEVEEDIKQGLRNMSGPFTAEEAIEHLRSL